MRNTIQRPSIVPCETRISMGGCIPSVQFVVLNSQLEIIKYLGKTTRLITSPDPHLDTIEPITAHRIRHCLDNESFRPYGKWNATRRPTYLYISYLRGRKLYIATRRGARRVVQKERGIRAGQFKFVRNAG